MVLDVNSSLKVIYVTSTLFILLSSHGKTQSLIATQKSRLLILSIGSLLQDIILQMIPSSWFIQQIKQLSLENQSNSCVLFQTVTTP